MIGPLKFVASLAALVLVAFLLVTLSTAPAEAGPEAASSPSASPAPHEWLMVVVLFALVVAYHQVRVSHHH
jgi:uncharacterized membrane protein YphA (DoxX/SURF4 family)